MAITPVGGWSHSNVYHEYYFLAFTISVAMCYFFLIVIGMVSYVEARRRKNN
jgi:hypothetical protein